MSAEGEGWVASVAGKCSHKVSLDAKIAQSRGAESVGVAYVGEITPPPWNIFFPPPAASGRCGYDERSWWVHCLH